MAKTMYDTYLSKPVTICRDAITIYWWDRELFGPQEARKRLAALSDDAFAKDVYNLFERHFIPWCKENKWFGRKEGDWIVRDGRFELVNQDG